MKEENEISNQPRIVKSHDVRIDTDYAEWIAELKHRYRSAQVKASVRVNAEKLLFNWELGRDLVQKKAEERWGAGVVEQVSLDLQREFPNADGFSTRNIWYMKQWYLFYYQEDTKLHQLGAVLYLEFLYQLGKVLYLPDYRTDTIVSYTISSTPRILQHSGTRAGDQGLLALRHLRPNVLRLSSALGHVPTPS